jgi:hypothetical protein
MGQAGGEEEGLEAMAGLLYGVDSTRGTAGPECHRHTQPHLPRASATPLYGTTASCIPGCPSLPCTAMLVVVPSQP